MIIYNKKNDEIDFYVKLFNIRILSFYLPPILSQTIPMGIFLGVMLTFSKFTRTSEATA